MRTPGHLKNTRKGVVSIVADMIACWLAGRMMPISETEEECSSCLRICLQ
jgi:hypothetical protein